MNSIPIERCSFHHVTEYGSNWMMYYRGFTPEDVLGYYDIYDNGCVYIYIKQKKRFLWFTWEKIWRVSNDEDNDDNENVKNSKNNKNTDETNELAKENDSDIQTFAYIFKNSKINFDEELLKFITEFYNKYKETKNE